MRLVVGLTQVGSTSTRRGPSGCLRLALLCFMAMAAFLVSAAQASAAEVPLTIETEGNGEGIVSCKVESLLAECEAEYPEGTKVVLVPEPEFGSEFTGWAEDCTGTGTCELTMDEGKSVTATFELEEFVLTIETEGNGEGVVECQVEGGPYELCPENETYPYGTEVILFAETETGSEFVEWLGDCSGVEAECQLTIEESLGVVATFAQEPPFELAISIVGTGSGEVLCEVENEPAEECEAEYEEGTEVALVPEPETGSEFVKWEGDCTGSGACEPAMDEDRSVTAIFDLEPETLTVEVKGPGTVTAPKDIDCPGVCAGIYGFGETVTLTAEPEAGAEFVKWEGCDAVPSAEECEVTMEEDRSVKAVFALVEFTLKVEKKGGGSGTVTSSPAGITCGVTCTAKYLEGETVTLTAFPSAGSEFGEWAGCEAEPSTTECEVTIEEDTTISARFDIKPPSEFALTVVPAGTGTGTVTSSPAGIDCGIDCSDAYATGTEVTLTATPASGSSFAGWSGACAGAGACKVTMSQTRSVTATFTKESTPPPPGPGIASVAPTAKVKSGKALLKLTCKGEGPCKGSLKLTAKVKSGGKTKNLTIGKGSFSFAAGATKTLKVKLSVPAKQAVAKGPLKAKAKGSGVRSSTVKLKE